MALNNEKKDKIILLIWYFIFVLLGKLVSIFHTE